LVSAEDWDVGTLAPRGAEPAYSDSRLEASAVTSIVTVVVAWLDQFGIQLVAYGDAVAGDWFVLDYHAETVGSCDVALYDLDWNLETPIEILSLTHVPTRDFDGDTLVNFADFALLAARWHQGPDTDPNAVASPDLNGDGWVDPLDVALFSEFWIDRTDCNEPLNRPTVEGSGEGVP